MTTRSQFLRPPRTEQEVVCLFGALLQDLEWPVVIERLQTGFPDCTLYRTDTKTRLRAEFELLSSHFLAHGHDPEQCDLIICWRDDQAPTGMDVLELRQRVIEVRKDLLQSLAEPTALDEEGFLADARQHGASDGTLSLLAHIIGQARQRGWMEFGAGPEVVLTVRDSRAQFFKIYSPDVLSIPLSRLPPDVPFTILFDRLNGACPSLRLAPGDERSKGKGGRVGELFASDKQVEALFGVWDWLRRSDA